MIVRVSGLSTGVPGYFGRGSVMTWSLPSDCPTACGLAAGGLAAGGLAGRVGLAAAGAAAVAALVGAPVCGGAVGAGAARLGVGAGDVGVLGVPPQAATSAPSETAPPTRKCRRVSRAWRSNRARSRR